ncbi:MAG: hypothetical protein D6701_15610, partial [Gemmatimonadetes bacterium]
MSVRAGRGAAAAVAALTLGACGIPSSTLAPPSPAASASAAEAAALEAAASEAFARRPRTSESVRRAYQAMARAARSSDPGDPARYDRLWLAARYALWLSAREPGKDEAWADSALVFLNTAVEADSTRVEGYYYRAIAAGRFAQDHKLRGRAAMVQVREDGRRAVALDPTYDGGGPHRVLGALYLRAPGPPAGVGSLRRALQHLERARELGPDQPDNLLFLAEAYLEDDRPKA